ncbi:MAG: hypothetical protein P1U36_07825 [Legionellaceae bacterium]|nr:hypothetical protein [Legionellaceae bacterium]
MYHYLIIQQDTSISEALAGIPAGVSKLSLSGGGLYANNHTKLEYTFEAIPKSVISLDLSLNDFENISGDGLVVAFASIPKHVTSVDFSMSDLYLKSGAELARALAGIPETVKSLDLSGNDLYKKKSADLALGLSGISTGVNTLILAGNGFGHKTSAQLSRALAGIPAGVQLLNLRCNHIHLRTRAELVQIFAGIPKSVTSLDLSNSQLGHMSAQELDDFIQIIPFHIKYINLQSNDFFKDKTSQEIDEFLIELGEARTRLDLSCNGEPELARVVAPLVQMETSGVTGVGRHVTFSPEVTAHIASFISDIPEQSIYHQIKTRAQAVGHRKARDAYIASWFQFSHDMLSMPPIQFAIFIAAFDLFAHASPSTTSVFGTGLTIFGAASLASFHNAHQLSHSVIPRICG